MYSSGCIEAFELCMIFTNTYLDLAVWKPELIKKEKKYHLNNMSWTTVYTVAFLAQCFQ